MVTKIDATQFIDDSDFSTPKEIPYAQWINPQSSGVGLGIKVSQAELAGFTPDDTWEKKTLELGSDKEEVYIASEPRLIILNGASTIDANNQGSPNPLYMHNVSTGEKRFFDKDTYYADRENWTVYRPIILFPVGKDNQLLSGTPFVFNIKKASSRTLCDIYFKQWIPALLEAYKSVGVDFPKGKRPTCAFLARNIFEPIIQESKLQAMSSNAKSTASVCTGFKPIDFGKVAIPKDSAVAGVVKDYLANLMDLIAIKNKPQKEAIPAVADIDPDDFTDDNGEVHLPLDAIPF